MINYTEIEPYPSPNAELSLDEKVEVIQRYMKENDWKWGDEYPTKKQILETIERLRSYGVSETVEISYGGFVVTKDRFDFMKAIKNGKVVPTSDWKTLEVLLKFNEYVTDEN